VSAAVPVRTAGVDWSGARAVEAQRRHIWVAVVEDGELVELSAGRTREETVEHLVATAARPAAGGAVPATVAGLDFSFGFPEWFARAHGCGDGPASWALAARDGEGWLRDCAPPFFGARGTRRPPGVELFRRTERDLAGGAGMSPKSIFQLAGPGAVGPGSLRGMPLLTALRARGWAVWPFDAFGRRTLVEVYPALAARRLDPVAGRGTDPSRMRIPVADAPGRRRFVDALRPGMARAWPAAVESRDAFDAVVAAFWLAELAGELMDENPGCCAAVPAVPAHGIEGAIWPARPDVVPEPTNLAVQDRRP
jgi:PAS domain-containing protein